LIFESYLLTNQSMNQLWYTLF